MGKILELENYAKENLIPIMQKDGINFLLEYIKNNDIKNILEIGTAIGYSAINFALISENIKVTTIEKDLERYNLACQYIKEFDLNNQIDIIFGDALETKLDDKYDLIFIDAAKSQYIKFFEKYKCLLNSNGVIVSDNLSFHGLVEETNRIKNRNTRQLVSKIKKYIEFLKTNKEFDTVFYNIGDGISISKKV